MTKAEATTKATKRTDRFRSDPKIPTGSATTADYRRSGYDRGHLAPAADMAFSVLDTFLSTGAISLAQHDKSLNCLIEKMGIGEENR